MRKTPSLVALALIAALAGAVRAQDPSADALLRDAQTAEAAQKSEEACKLYERLLELYPRDAGAPRVRLRLGLALAKLGRVEAARARLREARATGKADEALCREAEKALLALPPAPEPKPEKPKPKPEPETGPRAELQGEVAKLEEEVRGLIRRAQELEDAGQQGDAFALRGQADKKAAELEARRRELAAMPRGPAKRERPIDKKLEKLERKGADDPGRGQQQKQKMMARRKAELETTARQAEQRAGSLAAAGRVTEAASAIEQAARARREAFEIGKRLAASEPSAPPATKPAASEPAHVAPPAAERPIDPFIRREQEAREAVKLARAAVGELEKAGDPARLKKAREELAAAQKVFQAALAERESAAERFQLERLAEQLRKRGAPTWEVEERLALAKTEAQLVREHRKKRRKLDVAAAAELDREHRTTIEQLRAEGEERIAARGRSELDRELQQKQAELVARGLSEEEATRRVAAVRREREARMGKKDAKDDDDLPEVKGGKRLKRLMEENQRLRRRVEELERENAALRAKGAD